MKRARHRQNKIPKSQSRQLWAPKGRCPTRQAHPRALLGSQGAPRDVGGTDAHLVTPCQLPGPRCTARPRRPSNIGQLARECRRPAVDFCWRPRGRQDRRLRLRRCIVRLCPRSIRAALAVGLRVPRPLANQHAAGSAIHPYLRLAKSGAALDRRVGAGHRPQQYLGSRDGLVSLAHAIQCLRDGSGLPWLGANAESSRGRQPTVAPRAVCNVLPGITESLWLEGAGRRSSGRHQHGVAQAGA